MTTPRMSVLAAASILCACTAGADEAGDSGSTGAGSESSSTVAPTTTTTTTSSGETLEGSSSDADSTSTGDSTSSSTGASSSDEGTSSTGAESSSTGVDACPGGPQDDWAGILPPELVTATPYDFDAGIADLIALAPPEDGTVALSKTPVAITGATVAMVGYPEESDLWIADANAHVRVTLSFDDAIDGLLPGDMVDLEVIELTAFDGTLSITGLGGATIVDSDQPVWVQDAEDIELDYDSHPDQIVSVWGELTETLGACGGSHTCYRLSHCGGEVDVRIPDFLAIGEGDVVQIVAPLVDFAQDIRFQIDHSDWIRILP